MPEHWSERSIPDQTGKVFLVTGANSGLGWETARALAGHGAHVLVGARTRVKATEAIERITATSPAGTLEPLVVDLSDLDSVATAAETVLTEQARLDALVNNAGIMMTPYGTTAQGFEQQLGVNHLGHFALTGRVLPLLMATERSRVVSVSSNGHRPGRIRFDDLQSEQSYSPYGAYFQSKLANLLFTAELQRRLEAAGSATIAAAAHPGASNTNLGHENPGGVRGTLMGLLSPLSGMLGQSAAMGALPQLRAATDPDVQGDDYYGPSGFAEMRGYAVPVDRSDRAKDAATAARLWDVSAELTGVGYEALSGPADTAR
jgi:NAD(P)-dependent dehydrogenase (short-subunit alcohol dehydrogenase family)